MLMYYVYQWRSYSVTPGCSQFKVNYVNEMLMKCPVCMFVSGEVIPWRRCAVERSNSLRWHHKSAAHTSTRLLRPDITASTFIDVKGLFTLFSCNSLTAVGNSTYHFSHWDYSENCLEWLYYAYHWLHSFSNLDRSRSIRAKRSAFIIKSDLLQRISEKTDLATPICAAGHQRRLFTFKRGRGLRCSAQTRTRWPHPLRPERSACSFSPDWIDLIWQI